MPGRGLLGEHQYVRHAMRVHGLLHLRLIAQVVMQARGHLRFRRHPVVHVKTARWEPYLLLQGQLLVLVAMPVLGPQ